MIVTDLKFHNTGIAARNKNFAEISKGIREDSSSQQILNKDGPNILAHLEGFAELGRFNVMRGLKDMGAFKTPSLRDVELTSPYMHDGSEKTLLDVVKYYNQGGLMNPNLDSWMHPLNLTEEEMSCLVEFMKSLTSDEVLRRCQMTKPQSRYSR